MNHWVRLFCACRLFPDYRNDCSSDSESGELVDPPVSTLGRADVANAMLMLDSFPDVPVCRDLTLTVNATDSAVQ